MPFHVSPNPGFKIGVKYHRLDYLTNTFFGCCCGRRSTQQGGGEKQQQVRWKEKQAKCKKGSVDGHDLPFNIFSFPESFISPEPLTFAARTAT